MQYNLIFKNLQLQFTIQRLPFLTISNTGCYLLYNNRDFICPYENIEGGWTTRPLCEFFFAFSASCLNEKMRNDESNNF